MSDSHFPETDLGQIRGWCTAQSAKLPADQLRITCSIGARAVDIGEERPP